MIAQEQFTQIYTDCQVEEVDGFFRITGSFRIFATIDPASSELWLVKPVKPRNRCHSETPESLA